MRGTVEQMATWTEAHRSRVNNFVQQLASGHTYEWGDYYLSSSDFTVKYKEEVEQGVTLGDALDRLEE